MKILYFRNKNTIAVAEGGFDGVQARLIRQIYRKLHKGKEVSQIAKNLEEDEIRIQVICNEVARFAPDYDEEKVIKAMMDSVVA